MQVPGCQGLPSKSMGISLKKTINKCQLLSSSGWRNTMFNRKSSINGQFHRHYITKGLFERYWGRQSLHPSSEREHHGARILWHKSARIYSPLNLKTWKQTLVDSHNLRVKHPGQKHQTESNGICSRGPPKNHQLNKLSHIGEFPGKKAHHHWRLVSGCCLVNHSIIVYLLGGFNPSEQCEFVSWDDEIPNIWKSNKCSKPPSSCSKTISKPSLGGFHKWQPNHQPVILSLVIVPAHQVAPTGCSTSPGSISWALGGPWSLPIHELLYITR